jgi:predicted amidohydrolase YtcJ
VVVVSDKRKSLNGPESGEKKVGRRGFLKVALGAAAAIIAAAAGLILIRKPQKQETVAPPSVTSAPVTPATQPPQTADLVLINGKIITVDHNDSIAEAVAVSGGKITKVGTTQEIGPLIGDYTQVIDLKGKTVTPGLTDAHCHTGGGWAEIYQLDVRPNKVGSIADIVKLIDEKVKETPSGEWILGFGWRPDGWPERRRPNRSDLDPVSPNHPVFLTDSSGWYGWVNSYALRLAGIDENTPNPVGGVIDRDSATNLPTGLLVNHAAMWLVKKPTPTKEQCEEGIRYASNLFVAEGVTTIHDNWVKGIDLMQAYQSLDDLGEPPARTDVYYHINSEEEAEAALTALKTLKPFKHAVTFKGWKLQVDGGAATAFTYEPHNGYAYTIPSLPPDVLKRIVSVLHKSGYQISIHVGGDRAIDVTLDAIEAALKENPRPNHRHRLEHVIVSPKEGTLERIKELGVVISVQPSFVYHSGDIWLNLFGQERVKMAAPVKTAIDMGIPVAFGSDYPCTVDTSPQLTLWSAITRQTSTGVIIGGQESVDVRQALRIHTMGSAYAANEENVKGSIEAGKQADLVVWSDDIYSIPTDKIRDLKAELVIIEGQILLK